MTREVYVLEEHSEGEGWYPVLASDSREYVESEHQLWPDTQTNPKRIVGYVPQDDVHRLQSRVEQLADALRRLTEPMCSIERDNGVVRSKMLVVSGDDALDRYRAAVAVLEADTRG